MTSLLRVAFVLCGLFSIVAPSFGHEFIVKPEDSPSYTGSVPISVYSTHVFVKGEELESADIVKISVDGTAVALKENKEALVYEGVAPLQADGVSIIEGHRLPVLWSVTPTGEGEGGRSVHKDAFTSSMYEKFSKTLVSGSGSGAGFDRIIGHRLEIVPEGNPLEAKAGDTVRFVVLLDGKPAEFDAVYATYDGFTDIPAAWAFTAAPTGHSKASVKLTGPGFWLVQVAVTLDEKTKEYDNVQLKAVLAFSVQK